MIELSKRFFCWGKSLRIQNICLIKQTQHIVIHIWNTNIRNRLSNSKRILLKGTKRNEPNYRIQHKFRHNKTTQNKQHNLRKQNFKNTVIILKYSRKWNSTKRKTKQRIVHKQAPRTISYYRCLSIIRIYFYQNQKLIYNKTQNGLKKTINNFTSK